MKPVLLNKRKYNFKDILRGIGIFLLHYIVYYGWTFMFIYVRDLQDGFSFNIVVNIDDWLIIYPLTFGPGISAITHILYAESGKTNLRAMLWLHSLVMIIAVPIFVIYFM